MNNSSKNSSGYKNIWLALPIIIFAALVPLMIGFNNYTLPFVDVPWNPSTVSGADLFNLVKSRAIIFSGLLSLVFLFFTMEFKGKKRFQDKTAIVIAIFLGSLVLSFVFSFNKWISLSGSYERFEGIFVWIAYLLNALYTGSLFRKKETRWILLRAILISGLIITGIGAFQYFGLDIYKNISFQKLFLPDEMVGKIGFTFEEGRIYTTLYNPNYVALYAAMLLPFSLIMSFADQIKGYKVLWLVFSVLLGINMLGSGGRGGILGLGAALIAIVILMGLKKINNRKVNLVTVVGLTLVSVLGFGILASGKIEMFKGDVVYNTTQVLDIKIDKDKVNIQYGEHQLNLKMDLSNMQNLCLVLDENGKDIISQKGQDNVFIINDERYPNAKYLYGEAGEGYYYIELYLDGINWPFIMQEDGFMYVNNLGGRSLMKPVDKLGFEGSERLGSNRGYIWSRTLPMILKSPIWGYGPDNYAYVFPQEDYVDKQIYYGSNKILVDKPHNFYLQMLTSFGLVGFIALYALFGTSISFLYNRFTYTPSRDKWLYLGILCGIFGYLGAGLFYDSTVNVSPIFWTFIGVGLQGFFGEDKFVITK